MVQEIEKTVKTEYYRMTNRPSTHKLCLVTMNREYLRRILKETEFQGCNGAKLAGSAKHQMAYGFVYFDNGTDAWRAWRQVMSLKVLAFVQSEIEREWAFNYLTEQAKKGGDDATDAGATEGKQSIPI